MFETYEGMYSMVIVALFVCETESCDPENEDAGEKADAGDARSIKLVAVATKDFMVLSSCLSSEPGQVLKYEDGCGPLLAR
jgi:hypothetical protein